VYVEPPADLKTEGKIWKLKKPLYGLDDASRKWWLRIKEIFKKAGLKIVIGDEAFYYYFEDGKLIGMILTHVDNFFLAGTQKFLSRMGEIIKRDLQISKVEKKRFRFTGIDVEQVEGGIKISMNAYAESPRNYRHKIGQGR
jgi:hypothetical protein